MISIPTDIAQRILEAARIAVAIHQDEESHRDDASAESARVGEAMPVVDD